MNLIIATIKSDDQHFSQCLAKAISTFSAAETPFLGSPMQDCGGVSMT